MSVTQVCFYYYVTFYHYVIEIFARQIRVRNYLLLLFFKWGASSQWSSQYCHKRNSDAMTIGKTHLTLLDVIIANFFKKSIIT